MPVGGQRMPRTVGVPEVDHVIAGVIRAEHLNEHWVLAADRSAAGAEAVPIEEFGVELVLIDFRDSTAGLLRLVHDRLTDDVVDGPPVELPVRLDVVHKALAVAQFRRPTAQLDQPHHTAYPPNLSP